LLWDGTMQGAGCGAAWNCKVMAAIAILRPGDGHRPDVSRMLT
jgi:hypothetical protein